jgi:hypothetical protein
MSDEIRILPPSFETSNTRSEEGRRMTRYMRIAPDADITLRVIELAELAKQGVRILGRDLR